MEVGGHLLLVTGLRVHDEPLARTGPWIVDRCRLLDGGFGVTVGGGVDDHGLVGASGSSVRASDTASSSASSVDLDPEGGGLVGHLVRLGVVVGNDLDGFDLGKMVAVVAELLGDGLFERGLLLDDLVGVVDAGLVGVSGTGHVVVGVIGRRQRRVGLGVGLVTSFDGGDGVDRAGSTGLGVTAALDGLQRHVGRLGELGQRVELAGVVERLGHLRLSHFVTHPYNHRDRNPKM